MLVFSTPLVNYRPSKLPAGSPAPPSLCEKVQGDVFIHCVRERGPQTDKHQPPRTFAGKYLRKADI